MSNGDVYFCDRIPDASKIVNIREIEYDVLFELIKKACNKGLIDNFRPCNKCELKYICGGGCRAEYFREFTLCKDIDSIDFSKINPRKCDSKHKDFIYNLMIKTNKYFYD